MKQPIRYFSIGLITASIIMFIVVTLVDKPKTASPDELDINEMIASIKDKGYHVLSSSEYITLSTKNTQKDNEENEEKPAADKEPNENKAKDNEKDKDKNDEKKDENEANDENDAEVEVHSYTLNVKPNMLGPEISELLVKNKIIDNAEKFNRYLETEGYAEYIQLGKFKLNSDMSNYEIAEKIARKK